MKVSKLFISTAAVVSVVGAIGFAYAQSGNNAMDNKSNMQNQNNMPRESMPNSNMQNPTGAAGDATNNTSNMANERIARTDRN